MHRRVFVILTTPTLYNEYYRYRNRFERRVFGFIEKIAVGFYSLAMILFLVMATDFKIYDIAEMCRAMQDFHYWCIFGILLCMGGAAIFSSIYIAIDYVTIYKMVCLRDIGSTIMKKRGDIIYTASVYTIPEA